MWVAQTITSENPPTTISHAYQQILLIVLADPYHLMHGELAQVIELARTNSHLCSLELKNTKTNRTQIFSLDLNTDAPPQTAKLEESNEQNDSTRFFSTSILVEYLLYLLAKLESGMTPASLGLSSAAATGSDYRNLLHRLISSWGKPHLRHFNRYDNQPVNIELSLGLRTIHALLSAKSTMSSNDDMPINITINNNFTVPEVTNRNHYISTWQVLNNSAQGNALRNQESVPTHIKGGELIAMRENTNGRWHLYVIKWDKSFGTGLVEIGVQLLPPQAHPVALYNPALPISSKQLGILFPENSALKQSSLLLTPHGIYKKNADLCFHADGTHAIALVKLTMQTQSFDLFELATSQ